MLNQEEKLRYSRQIILPGIGESGQEKIKQAKVLVVGAGGLGSPVILYLTAAGVGTIGIIDGDNVDVSNLQRQILYTTNDSQKNKSETAKQKIAALNPNLNIETYNERLNNNNALNILGKYHIVVDGSDNFPTRYLINDACVILNKPFVSGSVYRFEGQLSVFNYKDGPTYRCLFPEPPGADEMPDCSEAGVLGVLPGIIGSYQAAEVIKIITGIGEVLSKKMMVINILQNTTYYLEIETNRQNKQIKTLANYDLLCGIKKIKSISADELKELMKQSHDFQLIDVREKEEHNTKNIGGVNIPLSVINENINLIEKNKTTILHCKSGVRSIKAIELLEEKYHFENLYNLEGGIDAWQPE